MGVKAGHISSMKITVNLSVGGVSVRNNIDEVNVYGDSKLVIEQVKGNWKVKSDTLRPIYLEIQKHITPEYFTKITFNHVRRHLNKRADELANVALDNAQ